MIKPPLKKRLSPQQKDNFKHLTKSFLKEVVRFKCTYDVMVYLQNDALRFGGNFEERMSINYPINGIGIRATPSNLNKFNAVDGGFIDEQAIAPDEVTPHVTDFPLAAASAAYLFTLLEGFGDDLVTLVNPAYSKTNHAWHREVSGKVNTKDQKALQQARLGFAKAFNLKPEDISLVMTARLVHLKKARNKFMHEAERMVDLENFIRYIVAIVCHLYFIFLPKEKEIKIFPWTHHDQQFN
jgi:hypothetical protein